MVSSAAGPASRRRGVVCRSSPVPSALVSCGWRLGVDAQCAEARGQVLDPLWWRPVIRQREAGFAAPQHVAEGVAQMPGHHPGTVTGYPLSSGATALSASRSAATEHSASHCISGNPIRRLGLPFSHDAGSSRHRYRVSERVGGLDHEARRRPHRTVGIYQRCLCWCPIPPGAPRAVTSGGCESYEVNVVDGGSGSPGY